MPAFPWCCPSDAPWFSLVANLEKVHRSEGLDLVVIDALATLLPGYAETCARARARAPARFSGRTYAPSSLSRSALWARARARAAGCRDRRRRIRAYSRSVQTPRHLIMELDASGADYLVRTNETGTPLVQAWPEVHYILSRAMSKFSQQDILERWPTDDDPPDRSTRSRWLKRATQQGLICCSGSGYRGDSFRYWFPGHEPLLWPGNYASQEEKQAWRERYAAHMRGLGEGWVCK